MPATMDVARLALALALAAALTLACGEEPVAAPPVARPVKMLTIGGPAGAETLDFPGQIRPARQADMGFEVPGKLTEFPVKEGDEVAAGTVLASIDPRDYESKLAEARAKASQAAKDVERYRYLVEQGVSSQRDLELKERNYKVFLAELETARKAVDDTVLKAPFDGVVARKLMEDFTNVQAKETVLILQDDSNLEIRVSIPERDLAGRSTGERDYDEINARIQPVVTVSALPDRRFPARLTEIATAADPTTRTYQATFAFANPPDVNVLPGMTAKVRLLADRAGETAPTGISVPVHAVIADEENQPFVWTIDTEAMTAHRRNVSVGELRGDRIQVTAGLSDGDVIAVSGLRQLLEGRPVRRYETSAAR